MMKAVHFGAGNIGRGFIGLLLSQAGYKVTFVDVNEAFVAQLQERGEYPVTLASEGLETVIVKNVTALSSVTHAEEVAAAIAEADLVTTAVGVSILKHIAGTVADGIRRRLAVSSAPLHVIACENAIGGSAQLKELVYAKLDEADRAKAEASVAFPNAAVDRIVPLQQHEDILKVVVEPFYEWVVDASQMLPGYTPVEGVHYVDNLEPYIERKLFTVNTGHCSAAYLGFLQGRAAACTAFALTAHAQLRAVIHTGRDTHMNLALSLDLTLTCAGGACLLDDLACTAAIRARTAVTHLSKRCILHEFLLSAAVADGTGLRLRTRLSPGAEAGVTGLCARNGDICLFAEYRFLELNGHCVLQVAAALRCVRITPSAAAEEHIEDIAETAEIPAAAEAAAHSLVRVDMPVLVITRPLLPVAEDIVGFLDLFELLLGVARLIYVRMILARQLAVGLLHFIF